MGGYGSGKHASPEAQTVESSLRLSADYVVSKAIGYHAMSQPNNRTIFNVITWTRGEQKQSIAVFYRNLSGSVPDLVLDYVVTRADGERIPIKTHVGFTAVNYEHQGRSYARWFFRCPTCNRRVSKLYQPPGALRFACRHCHALRYRAQIETRPPAYLSHMAALIDLDVRLEKAYEQLFKARGKRRQRIAKRIDRLSEKGEKLVKQSRAARKTD